MMTRKDYVKFAEMINRQARVIAECGRDNTDRYKLGADDTIKITAQSMAEIFKADNPNFDYSRFMAACFKGID